MTGTCFGDLGGVKSCWGYKLKLVSSKEETKDTLFQNVRLFTLKELEKATNNFSTRLGEGGYSAYHKGTLENGTEVMIRVFLHSQGDVNRKGDSDLSSLVNILSKIRHRNVVELIGCCPTADRVFMIFEFVGDYNLDHLLFSENLKAGSSQLGWASRASICVGIARGLEYLHGDVCHRAVHLDIKPSSIVLDSNFNPKIVGFGLAELLNDDDLSSCHSAAVVGTYGYVDPEYIVKGRYTEKSDVYSFGIILLEVISGRKALEFLRDGSGVTLVSWVWGLRETDRVLEIVDPSLSGLPEDEVNRFIDVALWCVQSSSNLRPNMSEALLMLLGPSDLSNKVLTNPEESDWLSYQSYHDEVNSPIFPELLSKPPDPPPAENTHPELVQFTIQELKSATRNFRPDSMLGEGGFGCVFKGLIDEYGTPRAKPGTGVTVAVKRLNPDGLQGHREWVSEVDYLGQLHHPNLVKLIGYCSEDDQRLLVYEYMSHGSLEKHLFRRTTMPLSWPFRMKIALGVAKGLAFLHGSEEPVIYSDFKTSNILLDTEFNAKLSDFGLAKAGPQGDNSNVSTTRVVGTYGYYVAPEYVMTGHLTSKSDVYSFGVVLLEILTGRRLMDKNRPINEQNLVTWARPYLNNKRKLYQIVDPGLERNYSIKDVRKVFHLAYSCLNGHPKARPSMDEIVKALIPLLDNKKKAMISYQSWLPQSGRQRRNSPWKYDEKFGKRSAAEASSQAYADLGHLSTKKQHIGRAQGDSATASMRKNTRGFEIEIKSDLDTSSNASEQTEVSHNLETELCTSIEANIPTAASVSGPSAKNSMMPEIMSLSSPSIVSVSSLSTDTPAYEETANRAEEILIYDDEKAELQMGQTSLSDQSAVKVGMNVTTSVEIGSSIQNETVEGLSAQANTDKVLSDAAAWDLFCCEVGNVIDTPEIKPYAQALSRECYGSSVIISAIGAALRAESSVEEWKLALRNLQFGDAAITNGRCFFRCHIKYCFDRLKARDVKTCFLYTALFQEGKEIDESTLVECFISEGFVGGTTVTAYRKGHDIVECLTNASLLETKDSGLKLKMHHVVRESALEILSSDIEGYHVFVRLPESINDEYQSFQESSLVAKQFDKSDTFNIKLSSIHNCLTRAGANLKESPSMEEWEQATMIFLMDNQLSSLPSKLNCSTLVALLLQRNSCLRVIPASFFDSMSSLKILNLSNTRIKSLPDSFSRLSSLQILLLRDCERLLMLPPLIGLLKSLEVLDLQGTYVTHLPDSVGELKRLKLLRVSFYGSMNRSEYKKLPTKLVSHGIISGLKLRELGMFVYPGDRRWTMSASTITEEISSLKLSVLHYQFPKVENLEYFVSASQSWKEKYLTTFNMVVGHDFKRIVSLLSNDAKLLFNEGQRSLRFVNGENIPAAVVEVLTRTTSFCLEHHLSISYLSQFGIHTLDGLKICILMDCRELIGIVDNQEHPEQGRKFLPAVEYLSVRALWNLKSICVGHVAMGSLARLRCLSMHACPKLRYVFTCSMLEKLSNLEELVIGDCVSLKYVVVKDEDVEILDGDAASEVVDIRANTNDSIKENVKWEQSNVCEFPVLCRLKVLKLHYLPEICDIWRSRWPPLEYISFNNCPKLRNLHMAGVDGVLVKEIVADKAWWDSLEWDDHKLSKKLDKLVTDMHID